MVEVFAVVAGVVRLGEREVELQRELRVFRAAVSDDVARTERHQPSTWLAVYNESERHNNSFCSAQVCEEIVNYLFAPLEVQMGTPGAAPDTFFPPGSSMPDYARCVCRTMKGIGAYMLVGAAIEYEATVQSRSIGIFIGSVKAGYAFASRRCQEEGKARPRALA
jgi:hypothetical protein